MTLFQRPKDSDMWRLPKVTAGGMRCDRVEFLRDEWCLEGASGHRLVRICLFAYGRQAVRRAWFVQADAWGRSFDGGIWTATTGREAREECETLVPERLSSRITPAKIDPCR
jgi:hypothetical protein